jgi:oligoendopeptidase F
MSNQLAKGIQWDLSDLYQSIHDPKIETDLTLAETKAADFEKKYKTLFEKRPNGQASLASLMKDYKEIITLMTKPGVFSHLSFAEKTNDAAVGAFMQKIQVRLTDISAHLIFFEVQWNRLDAETAALWMNDPAVKNDRHFLEKMRAYAPFTLNESEEKIMAIKSNTSGSAFSRLFDEVMNNIPFYIEMNGERVKKTEGEVLSLFHSSDRNERKKASDSLAEGLAANTHLLTYIHNMILADHRSSLKI